MQQRKDYITMELGLINLVNDIKKELEEDGTFDVPMCAMRSDWRYRYELEHLYEGFREYLRLHEIIMVKEGTYENDPEPDTWAFYEMGKYLKHRQFMSAPYDQIINAKKIIKKSL